MLMLIMMMMRIEIMQNMMTTKMTTNDIAQALFVQLRLNIVTNQALVNSSHTPKTAQSHFGNFSFTCPTRMILTVDFLTALTIC